MQYFVLVLELVGTIAFAVSGAMVGIQKSMDIFGVCTLGLTTACGGGLVRDVLLGRLPPAMFSDPVYALTALGASILVFLACALHIRLGGGRRSELLLLLADSAGLGIFTVAGVEAAVSAGWGGNVFFTVFLGTVTGVGGGLLRDVMAENPPYIFVKHIYACASIAGAVVCCLLWRAAGRTPAMLIGCAVIIVIRLLAARFRWSLPRIRDWQQHSAR